MATADSNAEQPAAPREGDRFGHYVLIKPIAVGGTGTVYEAYEESLHRHVAVKVLAPHVSQDRGFVERFRKEAQILAGLTHPNIIQIYFIGQERGNLFFAMELVHGYNLETLLKQHKQFTVQEAILFVRQAALGLQHAHNHGVLHCDVKPGNLLATTDGVVKVTDFGLARNIQAPASNAAGEFFVGTPDYVSPEEAAGLDVDHRSDIYSLGATLYHFVAGRTPYTGSPEEILRQHVESRPPRIQQFNMKAPQTLNPILDKMMAHDRNDRYQSYGDLLADLDRLLAMRPLSKSKTKVQPSKKKSSSNLILAAVGAVLIVGGIGAFVLSRPRSFERPEMATPPEAPTVANLEQEATDLWGQINSRVTSLVDGGSVGEALEALEAWPQTKYRDTHAHRDFEAKRRAIMEQANRTWQEKDAQAKSLTEMNKFDEAVAVYEQVQKSHAGLQDIVQKAASQIEATRTRQTQHQQEREAERQRVELERRKQFLAQVASIEPLILSLQFERAALEFYALDQQIGTEFKDLASEYRTELYAMGMLKQTAIEQIRAHPDRSIALKIGPGQIHGLLVDADRSELHVREMLSNGATAEAVIKWSELTPEDAIKIFRSYTAPDNFQMQLGIGMLLSRYAAGRRCPSSQARAWLSRLSAEDAAQSNAVALCLKRLDEIAPPIPPSQ